jgi:hypothetical protein
MELTSGWEAKKIACGFRAFRVGDLDGVGMMPTLARSGRWAWCLEVQRLARYAHGEDGEDGTGGAGGSAESGAGFVGSALGAP